MTPADYDTFAGIVMGFAELKGKQLSAPAIKLYWGALQHWSLADFRAAAEQLLRTCEFMPTPKDFEDLRKAGRPTAAEAWLEARSAARAWREFGLKPSSGDALIDLAVESIGGYRAIALCPLDRMGFLEKRFIEALESMQDAEAIRQAVPQLAYGGTTRRISGPVGMRDAIRRLRHESSDERE